MSIPSIADLKLKTSSTRPCVGLIMRIDGNQPYAWDEVNGLAQRALGLENTVQVFRGTSHALFEICLGLHLKFSHKRKIVAQFGICLLYTSPSPRDATLSRMPSSA